MADKISLDDGPAHFTASTKHGQVDLDGFVLAGAISKSMKGETRDPTFDELVEACRSACSPVEVATALSDIELFALASRASREMERLGN